MSNKNIRQIYFANLNFVKVIPPIRYIDELKALQGVLATRIRSAQFPDKIAHDQKGKAVFLGNVYESPEAATKPLVDLYSIRCN